MAMGIKNPLLIVYLLFVGSAILSSLNLGFIRAGTAQFNDSGYTARVIFRWRTRQPVVTTSSILSIWNPSVVRSSDHSSGKVSVIYLNQGNTTASMEAGYTVSPDRYGGDNFTRSYIKWKNIAANGTVTGCFDLDCPGFIAADSQDFIGRRLGYTIPGTSPTSASTFQLSIRQLNPPTGNWVLSQDTKVIGEWPDSLFTAKGSNRFNAVEIGGEVYDSTGDTTPRSQMGDGRFPSSIFNRGAYFFETYVIDTEKMYGVPSTVIQPILTNPACYRADFAVITSVSNNPALYYGGPGCSA